MKWQRNLVGLIMGLATLAISAQEIRPTSSKGGHPVYGASMPESGTVTPLSRVMANVDENIGKPVKISGNISQVCQAKGCWMILADGASNVRVTFKDYDFFIPKDSAGHALVYGEIKPTEVSEKDKAHLEKDGLDKAVLDEIQYEVVAQSVLIRKNSGS